MAIVWTGAGVFGTIGKAIKEYNADSVSESAMENAASSFVRAYISYNYRYLAENAYVGFDNVFWSGLVADMVAASQTIDGNAVVAGAVTFSGTGTHRIQDDVTPTEGQVTPTQMLLDDDVFRIACLSASAGNDSWAVYSMRRGRISGSCKTATLYGEGLTSSDKAGISFTILEPAHVVDTDVSSIFTSFAITGGAKNTNCDASGKIYVRVVDHDGYGTYTMYGYPTSTDRTNDTNRVFDATYDATGAATITALNSSGLAGTVTIATLVAADATIIPKIAYIAGDEFYVAACTSDDGGVIQTFFREAFKKTLPYNVAGAETIDDALAV